MRNKYKGTLRYIWLICLIFSNIAFLSAGTSPLFPTSIAVNEKGELLIAEKGTKKVDIFSPDGKTLIHSFQLDDTPTGILSDGNKIYVTTFETIGRLQILSSESGKVEKSIITGSGACYPLLSSDKKYIYVCNQFQNTVSKVDIEKKEVVATVNVLREPKSAVLSKDGKYLYVTNFLPAQRADVNYVAACITVIKADRFTKVKDIQLANGSNALRGICITPDGKYIYVSHNLGRFTVPTSQLQQGWMNTSAFSIIDVAKQEFLGAVVVDEPERGAAGIWSIACNDQSIFISHSGTHEVSVINHKAMLNKFLNYPDKSALDYDLTFLYGIRKRIPLQGNGPRSMVLTDTRLILPTYFADILNMMDIHTHQLMTVEMNPGREESLENKGERYFNDASHCFQNWQSCNGCHPGDARTDGMNWDLMNDGIGNPKNCKSLLFSHVTPPNMISGIREHAERAVRAGFNFIQFYDISEEDAVCVDAYLKSLRPVSSPYLINGKLSEKAQTGKEVFDRLQCGECHSGSYYTDMKMHRIGDDIEFEKGWDTPTLREVWRTAPYLFDGRAATMKEVFEVHKHGISKKISEKDIEALTEYVNSL
ncbi:YncE family protein [Bacteroides bouchesdurhonensis]|uniref:YncE family protein n=1 Tax=Bacteroides bouchesdurhonensis TaxID=1841855 RepID=UPI00097F936A|nr:YncE family protein [Bacteroides bouchesdurhonensis]